MQSVLYTAYSFVIIAESETLQTRLQCVEFHNLDETVRTLCVQLRSMMYIIYTNVIHIGEMHPVWIL